MINEQHRDCVTVDLGEVKTAPTKCKENVFRLCHLLIFTIAKHLNMCWCWWLIKERGQTYESCMNRQLVLKLLDDIAGTSYVSWLLPDQVQISSCGPKVQCLDEVINRTALCMGDIHVCRRVIKSSSVKPVNCTSLIEEVTLLGGLSKYFLVNRQC